MKLDELYQVFLPTFTMVEEEWNNFLAEKNTALSEAQNYLNAIFSITGYNLPTYEEISSTRYLGVYENGAQVTFEGSGIDKLFGGDMTTGTLSLSRIALDSYANNIHMAMLGYNNGITVDLNSGAVSGMFNEYSLTTPWFELSAVGTVAVSGASILSEMNIEAELTELSFTYPDDGVIVKLLGDIDYYQDELGNMEYSGDVYTAYFTGWGADITLNGDFQCDFDINNTFILFSDELTGELYVSELSLVIPSQHVVANFYNSLTGLSYDITSGSLGGSFNSFHFGTSLFDVYAHGSIYVEPVSSSSTLGIHGILDSIEITYPESTFAITVVGDVEYIQIDQGEYTYFGTMSEVYLENPTTTVSVLGDFSGSYNDSNGLHLAGNLYEFHWQREEAFISFVGDIVFGEDQLVVNEVTTLEVYGDGRYYDASSLSVMNIVTDVVGNELLALGEDANWDISAALDELLWDVINKLNGDAEGVSSVNFDSVPASSTPVNAEFLDFYLDLSKVGEAGYYASFRVGHLYDTNGDGLPDYVDEIHDSPATITWNNGMFTVLSLDDSSTRATGSLAYDGNGNAVGLYAFDRASGDSETTPPTLIAATPSDNAMGIEVESDLSFIFSENVQFGNGTIEIHRGSATGEFVESYNIGTPLSTNLNIVGSTLTINPTSDLASNTHYFVTFSEGSIRDLDGNNYVASQPYDFTTGADPYPTHTLTGNITFWKTGEAITDVTTTLTTLPTNGTHAIELKNIHVQANGSHTIEVWATTPNSTTGSFECEFALPTGTSVTWQDAAKLPSGWMTTNNVIATGAFRVASIGTHALAEGAVQLGTLTISQSANPGTFELAMTHAQLGNNDVAGYAISSVSSTTGSGNEYQYHSLTDGHYALTGDKAAGDAGSAVHANDALAALKMAVELNPNEANANGLLGPVSPFQYLAADINRDGKVRANDALNILKMAVGIESAPTDEWIFVAESVTGKTMDRSHVDWSDISPIVDFNQTAIELDLIGIVKGDVDGSWVMVG
uniref:SbsA Ig-like domain-containing protein n=1 Tax=Chlorobium chlorochromatii (strain CaD3) TaxID=340177 RepID=Q3APV2_CHLCH